MRRRGTAFYSAEELQNGPKVGLPIDGGRITLRRARNVKNGDLEHERRYTHSMDGKTYKRPPLVPTGKTPNQILSERDQLRLGRHYKSFLEAKKTDRKTKFSDEERSEIASIYDMLREQYGFYPSGIDANDRIIWGIALKSDIQMLMEKEGKKYEDRGLEVSSNKGDLGRLMESKRMVE